ncbi:hypothetical protein CCACVL1_06793 [Corchorus capsularis]|uniref:Uncharacterized protein n=1 Tax=Corchorus capsularis TaxID=210143 RepID=A0A1R3JCV9_COCAP|nr:hypothetical protein CCACVL1_06793 [Corchorus capsularis]
MLERQMKMIKETKYWVRRGPRWNGVESDPNLLEKKSLDEIRQMKFSEETKHWVRKGPRYDHVGRDSNLLVKKSLDEIMPECQMKFSEETKCWVRKGPKCDGVGRDPNLLEKKSLDEQKLCSGEAPKLENKIGIPEVHASETTNGGMIYFEEPKGTHQPIIGSQVAAETLNATYRLQLESKRAQLELGQPLAEFERFLHAASPVISFSHRCAPCAVCSVSQPTSIFLCKHQMQNNISLRALWNWYQKPGNYGLEVKTVDYNKQKGKPTEIIPFQAHFIPFLSAVQLFGKVRPEKQGGELNSSSAKTLPAKYSPKAIQPSH